MKRTENRKQLSEEDEMWKGLERTVKDKNLYIVMHYVRIIGTLVLGVIMTFLLRRYFEGTTLILLTILTIIITFILYFYQRITHWRFLETLKDVKRDLDERGN